MAPPGTITQNKDMRRRRIAAAGSPPSGCHRGARSFFAQAHPDRPPLAWPSLGGFGAGVIQTRRCGTAIGRGVSPRPPRRRSNWLREPPILPQGGGVHPQGSGGFERWGGPFQADGWARGSAANRKPLGVPVGAGGRGPLRADVVNGSQRLTRRLGGASPGGVREGRARARLAHHGAGPLIGGGGGCRSAPTSGQDRERVGGGDGFGTSPPPGDTPQIAVAAAGPAIRRAGSRDVPPVPTPRRQ